MVSGWGGLHKAVSLPRVELEKQVAALNPEEVRENIRAISEDRFSMKLGISEELLQKLKKSQRILSQKAEKSISLEETLEKLTTEFLEKHDPVQKAERILKKTKKLKPSLSTPNSKNFGTQRFPGTVRALPKPITRRIPNYIKHQIALRDKGLCQYQSATGNKCQSSFWVDIHHVKPYAMNGKHEISNLVTLCRNHHEYIHQN